MLAYDLLTKYGENFDKFSPLQEYPRPQFKRDSFLCLNGVWNYEINNDGKIPSEFSKEIVVPYPIESHLSGVQHILKEDEILIYKKEFKYQKKNDITILHFDAVDQEAEIILNGTSLGKHFGGYLPFAFDVSRIIKETNELIVIVKDKNSYDYPTGKQRKKRGGIFYTPTSGIWQTVWLEDIPNIHLENIKITPNINEENIHLELNHNGEQASIIVKDGNTIISEITSKEKDLFIKVNNPKLWSPEHPNLYDLIIKVGNEEIHSYFAMRKISIENNKICLNHKPYFINGVLDQGYYSDGIYTPASYDAYKDDILSMKELGFNALRKHIKIEPMMFYYYCDKLGMLVLQDMVNIGKYSFFKQTLLPFAGFKKLNLNHISKVQKNNFIEHSKQTIDYLYNVPSIIYYTIFNEGWGQFDGDKLYKIAKDLDPTRIIDATSGWFFEKYSDLYSYHIYLKKIKLSKKDRPLMVSEFGAYCYKEEGHSFLVGDTNGTAYKMYKNKDELLDKFIDTFENEIIPAKEVGLCGSVYTQLSDVEDECNGIYTYDRKICKLDKSKVKELMERVNYGNEK